MVGVLCLAVAACGDDSSGGSGGSGGDAAEPKKVGMALAGPRNDGGFNQANFEGLQAAEKELGVKGTVVENVTPGQPRLEALKNLAVTNDLVIGVGAEFAAAGVAVAPQFPDKRFVVVNGQLSDATNLSVYYVREGVPAYVAGTVAAKLTKTKKVGFVGGELIPPTKESDVAFKAAVEEADASIQYLTVNTGDFNNVALAKQATATLVSQGADVLFLMLDQAFAGAQQAIEESGKDVKVFSIIVPRCETATNIVGCATLNSVAFEVSIVKDFLDNKLPTGEMKRYGIEDPEVQAFELCPEWAKQAELTSIVEEQTKQINDGTLELPEGV
jgi:basic membrane protein A